MCIALVCLLSPAVSQSFCWFTTISLFIPSITLSFSCRSRSYLPDLLVIKSTDLLKDFNWLLSLIWLSFVISHICRTFSISCSNFSYNYRDFLHSVYRIRNKLSQLNFLCLFGSSRSLDLQPKSHFLLSKIFVIAIILKIF